MDIAWWQNHGDDLITMLTSTSSKQTSAKANRRLAQNFNNILCYMTDEDWDSFMAPDLDMYQRADFLCNKGCQLECTNGREDTFKYWASAALAVGMTMHNVVQIKLSTKKSLQLYIAKTHRALLRRAADKQSYVQILPANPEDVRTSDPELFARMFPTVGPAECRLDKDVVEACDKSFGCRGHGSFGSKQLALAVPDPANGSQDVNQLIQSLVQPLMQMFSQSMQFRDQAPTTDGCRISYNAGSGRFGAAGVRTSGATPILNIKVRLNSNAISRSIDTKTKHGLIKTIIYYTQNHDWSWNTTCLVQAPMCYTVSMQPLLHAWLDASTYVLCILIANASSPHKRM